jgi:AraC-like DNA-binding protein
MTSLLTAVSRYADAHADADGIATTPISSLSMVRATKPSDLLFAVYRPLVALVVQGAKQVTFGTQSFPFSVGESMVVSADIPTVSQITKASVASPYYSLVLELDPTLIVELSGQMGSVDDAAPVSVRVEETDAEVSDAALRLVRLLDRPATIPLLQAQLVREMHYWLLAGRLGKTIRHLGWPDGHAQRVGRAISILRTEFAQPLPVERLAAAAGMSPSSFHQHFRAITSLSPLQFQKHLRLIEARRLMLSEGRSSGHAAFDVGYESVSQFTREYGRMFGQPPARDVRSARGAAVAVS